MKTVICVSMTALFLVLIAGCSEPAPPPPDEKIAEPTGPLTAVVQVPEPSKPEPAVPQAEIEKAVSVYKVLNDAALSDAQKQEQAAAQLRANNWTEESYQALLYDIAQDQLSRAVYVELTAK